MSVHVAKSIETRGGNAIVAMRFDTTELGDVWTEICAYGTAVQAVPVTEAEYAAQQLGYGAGAEPQGLRFCCNRRTAESGGNPERSRH
jgi:hypothetical protein